MKQKILPIVLLLIMTFVTISSFNPHSRRNYRIVEAPVMVEDWMTQPFDTTIDEDLVVEDWMTKPFITN